MELELPGRSNINSLLPPDSSPWPEQEESVSPPPRRRQCWLPAAALFSGNPLRSLGSIPPCSAEHRGGFVILSPTYEGWDLGPIRNPSPVGSRRCPAQCHHRPAACW